MTRPRLQAIADPVGLDEAGYRRALAIAGLAPDRADWLHRIDRLLLAFGVAFVVAGIAAFFAYNWADLHRLAKFALVEAAIVAGVAVAAWHGIDRPVGRAALGAAAFLVGVLFAVFGQVYQTGADPYGLFVAWLLLTVGWAAIGRQPGLWILQLLLANLALVLYWTQVLHPPGIEQLAGLLGPLMALAGAVTNPALAAVVFALNALALASWELGAIRGTAWMRGRAVPRTAGVVALVTVVIATLLRILGVRFGLHGVGTLLAPLCYAGFAAFGLWYYRHRVHDLFMLALILFGGILIVTAFIGRFGGYGIGISLIVAVLLLAQSVAAALWLRQVTRGWEADS